MESQLKKFAELKRHCDLARAIPSEDWSTSPAISQAPLIKEYPGTREDLPFIYFWESINRLEAKCKSDIYVLEREIVQKGHMYLYPTEEVRIKVSDRFNIIHYNIDAQHRGDGFSNRFYAELSSCFNDILGRLFAPLYERGFRIFTNRTITMLGRCKKR